MSSNQTYQDIFRYVLGNICNIQPVSTFHVTDWLKGRELGNFRSLIGKLDQELAISFFTKISASAFFYFALIRAIETSHN